mmetsp:Transcript_4652/g.8815  ORF Transcript_4652/g.8815 Transcript_4652/m.8815 type:complete len:93 (+) Transcript_4652:32-310(+)
MKILGIYVPQFRVLRVRQNFIFQSRLSTQVNIHVHFNMNNNNNTNDNNSSSSRKNTQVWLWSAIFVALHCKYQSTPSSTCNTSKLPKCWDRK